MTGAPAPAGAPCIACRENREKKKMIASLFESHAATALKLRQSTAAERRAKLAKLLAAILERKEAILEAARLDLGKHPTETNLTEVLPLVGELKHAQAHLRRWMKPQRISPTLA